ncbi:MAG: pyridoxal-dependent decarboxylase [Gemmatimonadota bacterium]|jgi:aromatic-L-amino-acid/L-tryptophan decarboxylase
MAHEILPPGSADMTPEEFRRHGYAVVDRIAEYLAHPERWNVMAQIQPGDVAREIPGAPPADAQPMDDILADYDRIIVPGTTHWNHPGFFAYFGITASGPGILGEMLAASLNVNAMLWRSGPAETELEDTVLDWLRQILGLPEGLDGTINDTASSSTLYALAAARERAEDLGIRQQGLAGRDDVPPLRVYCSEEAHSSVDKAVITLGLGLDNVVRLPSDAEFRMVPELLQRAIDQDRQQGRRPLAVVATVGTTGVTAVDPVPEIADICQREGLWLHVDAAYGGSAAAIPEMRWVLDGCDRADSLVVNPHKWMFTPIDCSALFTRHPELLRRAFSLTPEYLKTAEQDRVKNLMDYGVSLGRRFRALKLWFVLRYFGADGISDRLREHLRMAKQLEGWVDGADDWERLAPVHFSVVAFRYRPADIDDEQELDRLNAAILDHVNATGEVFMSHTKVRDHYAIRIAIGNLRTTEAHVRRAWELLGEAAQQARGA